MAINMHKLHLVQRYVMYGLRTVRSGGKRKVATPTGMCEGKDPECVNRAEGLFADDENSGIQLCGKCAAQHGCPLPELNQEAVKP